MRVPRHGSDAGEKTSTFLAAHCPPFACVLVILMQLPPSCVLPHKDVNMILERAIQEAAEETLHHEENNG